MKMILGAVILTGLATSCGFRVVAPAARYPISASAVICDARDGTVAAEGYEVLHHFHHEIRHWTMLWRVIPLCELTHDVSSLLDAEISSVGADGIVNLTLTARERSLWLTLMNYLLLETFPSVEAVDVEGDVIKLRQVSPPEWSRTGDARGSSDGGP